MLLGTQEHENVMKMFEKKYGKCKLEREKKEFWPRGNLYCNGVINEAFRNFLDGYAMARLMALQGESFEDIGSRMPDKSFGKAAK